MRDYLAYHHHQKDLHFLTKIPFVAKVPLVFAISALSRAGLKLRSVPPALTLFVTERCNLRCPHCFVRNCPDAPRKDEMVLAGYQTMFQKSKNKIASIKITGGEPTLRPDLAQIIIAASTIGGVKYGTIFTNGTRRRSLMEVLETIIASCPIRISVQVSLDGNEQVHDKIRGKRGSYRAVIDTMQALSGIRARYPNRILRLSAATCVLRENKNVIPEIVDTVKSHGFEHVVSFPRSSNRHVFSVADEWKSNCYPVDYPVWEADEMALRLEKLDKIIWRGQELSLFKKTNKIVLETMVEMLKAQRPAVPCYAGKADLVIYSNGDVARCEMLKSVTNLAHFDYDIQALIQSERYRRYLKDTASCWCLHDCAIGSAIIHEPRLLEKFFS